MQYFMKLAIAEAQKAAARGSVPIGALVVRNRSLISSAGNEVVKNHDPTAHAEILAIRKACSSLKSHIIDDCDIYVTLAPCPMCAKAISLARIRRLYFGAYDAERGAEFRMLLPKTQIIGGVLEIQCMKILQNFFSERRT
ncbi:MAG: nucleoside deaminase [Holosporaceae bacterium]|jgi:tRNA(adenine34) deaminase|nr:nucleoside deaminase [Holosporaceae bacterium]